HMSAPLVFSSLSLHDALPISASAKRPSSCRSLSSCGRLRATRYSGRAEVRVAGASVDAMRTPPPRIIPNTNEAINDFTLRSPSVEVDLVNGEALAECFLGERGLHTVAVMTALDHAFGVEA